MRGVLATIYMGAVEGVTVSGIRFLENLCTKIIRVYTREKVRN